ncbi:MAG: diguanylate cyclase [Planctomycetes bacterium]|nr:diguanylate cyclase [Planctomycetota bacterium]
MSDNDFAAAAAQLQGIIPTPPGGAAPHWLYDELFGRLPCGFFRFRVDTGEFAFVTSCLPRNLGFSDNEFRAVCHNRFPELVHPADRKRVMEAIVGPAAGEGAIHCEFRIIAQSGREKWFYVIGSRNADAAGATWFNAVIAQLNLESSLIHSAMANLPAGVVIFDVAAPERPLFVSDQALVIYGITPQECQLAGEGGKPFAFIPPDHVAILHEALAVPGAAEIQEFTFRHVTRQGRRLGLRATCRLTRSEDGRDLCYAVIADVTGQIATARNQAKQREIFQMLMDDTRSLIFEYDVERDLMSFSIFSDNQRKMLKRERFLAEFFNQTSVHPDFRDEMLRRLREARSTPISDQFVYRADYDGHGYRWYRAHYKCVLDTDGAVFQVIGRARDVTSEIEATQRLQQRADMDALSGVYNRAKTIELANERLQTTVPDFKHTLMVLDIDNFKQIHDTCGHPAGDSVIRAIAGVLRATFRQDDILGRIGGDEFVVMTTTPISFELSKRAEVLQAKFRKIAASLGLDCVTSASIGIASAPVDGGDFQSLFVKADKALYAAKRGGRDRWVIYHDELGKS